MKLKKYIETTEKQDIIPGSELIYRFPSRLKTATSRVGGAKGLHSLTDIPLRTIQDWEAGNSEPRISRIAQVAVACGVSLDWLITGIGEADIKGLTNLGTIQVPKYVISVSAGDGSFIDFEDVIETIPMSIGKLHQLNIQPSLAFCIDVKGDSMEPIIPDGATVLAEKMNEYTHKLNGIYVFRLDDELYIKHLERGSHFPETLIRAENPLYEPRFIPAKKAATSLKVIARVALQ